MRFLLALIAWFALANSAFGAIAEVVGQKTHSDSSGSVDTLAIAFPINVTSGNLVCVGGGFYTGSSGNTVTVSDTLTSTFSTYSYTDNAGIYVFVSCAKVSSSAADTITIDPNANAYISAAIDEFSGVGLFDVDGGSATSDTLTTSGVASINITTVANNAIVFGVMSDYVSGSTSITEAGGWTLIGEQEDNSCCVASSFIFKVVGAAGVQTPSWTIGNTSGYTWLAYAISYKPTVTTTAVRHRPAVMQ